jgi:electron transfer flavoprotein alpha subunit
MSGILVIAEVRRGELREVTFELIGAAASLAADGAGQVRVAVVAPDPERLAQSLDCPGVDEILTVRSPLENFEAHLQAAAVSGLIRATAPAVVLAGHTIDSMGFAAAVAATHELGFATDVTALRWTAGKTVAERGVYGDRLIASIGFPGRDTVMVLLRPGVFPTVTRGSGGAAIRDPGVVLDPAEARTKHLGFEEPAAGDVDITKADFLLAIGRGVEDEADVKRMEELAEAIGATLASSRPLVDAGWLPSARQVGQSGRTVAPKVYLAMGISGAVQHIMGMKNAETIIAVNSDPNAPIFGVAGYGAVAVLRDVADELAGQFA